MDHLNLLTEWQKRLGILDWYITLVDNCDTKDIGDDADGLVKYEETTKSAIIYIIDPDKRGEALRPFDYEVTLVHELMHCKLALLLDGSDWERGFKSKYLHSIVDDLAKALVNAKRYKDEEEK